MCHQKYKMCMWGRVKSLTFNKCSNLDFYEIKTGYYLDVLGEAHYYHRRKLTENTQKKNKKEI